MSWKRASGRSKGQPAASDCSGNAGMVAGGEEKTGSRVWVSGSGLGKMGREYVVKRRVENSVVMTMMRGDMAVQGMLGKCCV